MSLTFDQRKDGIEKAARELQDARRAAGVTGRAADYETCRARIERAVKAGDLKRQE